MEPAFTKTEVRRQCAFYFSPKIFRNAVVAPVENVLPKVRSKRITFRDDAKKTSEEMLNYLKLDEKYEEIKYIDAESEKTFFVREEKFEVNESVPQFGIQSLNSTVYKVNFVKF